MSCLLHLGTGTKAQGWPFPPYSDLLDPIYSLALDLLGPGWQRCKEYWHPAPFLPPPTTEMAVPSRVGNPPSTSGAVNGTVSAHF